MFWWMAPDMSQGKGNAMTLWYDASLGSWNGHGCRVSVVYYGWSIANFRPLVLVVWITPEPLRKSNGGYWQLVQIIVIEQLGGFDPKRMNRDGCEAIASIKGLAELLFEHEVSRIACFRTLSLRRDDIRSSVTVRLLPLHTLCLQHCLCIRFVYNSRSLWWMLLGRQWKGSHYFASSADLSDLAKRSHPRVVSL
jgi:hypothetical protein